MTGTDRPHFGERISDDPPVALGDIIVDPEGQEAVVLGALGNVWLLGYSEGHLDDARRRLEHGADQ